MVALLLSLLFFIPFSAQSEGGKDWPITGVFKKNKVDKEGERHGWWRFYADSENQKMISKGRFKHGKETGTWHFYDRQQNLQKVEKYRQNRQIIKTTYYHPNGKIEKTGQAKLYEDATMLHYYWEGPWKFYSENGEYLRTEFYEKGLLQLQNKNVSINP